MTAPAVPLTPLLPVPAAPATSTGSDGDKAAKYATAILAYLRQQDALLNAAVVAMQAVVQQIETGLTTLEQQVASLPAAQPAPPPVDLQPLKDAINTLIDRSNTGLQYLADLAAYTTLGKKIDDELVGVGTQAPMAPLP